MYKFFLFLLSVCLICSTSILAKPKKSLEELTAAFARDGYDVTKVERYHGKRGIVAEHKTAFNYETKAKKKVFYVEGNGYQMGYLMGLLAQQDIEVMCAEFIDHIFIELIKADVDPKKIPEIMRFIKDVVALGSQDSLQAIPQEYRDEIQGMVDACKAVYPETKVTFNDLLIMNVGIDVLLSKIYALNNIWETHKNVPFTPEQVNIPVWCNAFSVFGKATADGKHYFGRDFMFPTGKVYQDYACLTIYNPTDGRLPIVSMAAPGFFGSMVAMNKEGVAMGVDMVPGGNCDPFKPGINSLPLVRHAMHRGDSAVSAVETIAKSQRGVSWLYPLADGKNNRSAVVEAGFQSDSIDFMKYVPEDLKKMLPDQAFLDRYENQKHQQGIMVRWNDYKYPSQFFDFNPELFNHHGKQQTSKSWGEKGFINKLKETNCPGTFYFPPQREERDDVLIVTNHYIVPSTRICSMNPMTALIAGGRQDDIQWRYDELNTQILDSYGSIDETKARELIDFLAPYGKYPEYYAGNKKSSDGKTAIIKGSVSLCNLSDRVMHSHFGYYADGWLTITLDNYIKD